MYGLESNTYNMIDSNSDSEALVNEMDNWLSSVSNFHNNLNENYAAYPDLLTGIILSINQVMFKNKIFIFVKLQTLKLILDEIWNEDVKKSL